MPNLFETLERISAWCILELSSIGKKLQQRFDDRGTTVRSSYYDADTADLEIGQEFEEAEAEEEAALEQQRASYKELDPADFGEEEEEEEDVDEDKNDEKKTQAGKKGSGKAKKRIGSSARGAALLEMKSDLEQIALGGGEEVRSSSRVLFCFIERGELGD